MTDTTLSRRVAITGLCAAVAVPVCGAADPTSDVCSFPELAARFSAIYRSWKNQREADNIYQAAFEEKVFAATGLRDWPDESAPEFQNYDMVRTKLAKAGSVKGEDEIWTAIHTELNPIIEQLLQQTPKTRADLALQVQAWAVEANELFLCKQSLSLSDQSEIGARRLVEAVCKFYGFDPLPGMAIVPLDEKQS